MMAPRPREQSVAMSRNPKTWGLKVPNRPPTPSEGYAQQYDRIGPAATQKLWTFDNGTCLKYGPDDPVDEFDPSLHPFCNQVALIDRVIRDIVVVRERHELTKIQSADDLETPHIEFKASEEDPFNNFRQTNFDPRILPRVQLASGIYTQVPSRYASISNLVSVYSLDNKSDVEGEAHEGPTRDTRFGVTSKPPPKNNEPEFPPTKRQDKNRRVSAQGRASGGVDTIRKAKGRGGGHQIRPQLTRISELSQYHNSPEVQDYLKSENTPKASDYYHGAQGYIPSQHEPKRYHSSPEVRGHRQPTAGYTAYAETVEDDDDYQTPRFNDDYGQFEEDSSYHEVRSGKGQHGSFAERQGLRRGRGGKQNHQAKQARKHQNEKLPEPQDHRRTRGTAANRDQVRGRGSQRCGRGHGSVRQHQRFKSQAYSVLGESFTEDGVGSSYYKTSSDDPLEDYEDEGPTAPTPKPAWIDPIPKQSANAKEDDFDVNDYFPDHAAIMTQAKISMGLPATQEELEHMFKAQAKFAYRAFTHQLDPSQPHRKPPLRAFGPPHVIHAGFLPPTAIAPGPGTSPGHFPRMDFIPPPGCPPVGFIPPGYIPGFVPAEFGPLPHGRPPGTFPFVPHVPPHGHHHGPSHRPPHGPPQPPPHAPMSMSQGSTQGPDRMPHNANAQRASSNEERQSYGFSASNPLNISTFKPTPQSTVVPAPSTPPTASNDRPDQGAVYSPYDAEAEHRTQQALYEELLREGWMEEIQAEIEAERLEAQKKAFKEEVESHLTEEEKAAGYYFNFETHTFSKPNGIAPNRGSPVSRDPSRRRAGSSRGGRAHAHRKSLTGPNSPVVDNDNDGRSSAPPGNRLASMYLTSQPGPPFARGRGVANRQKPLGLDDGSSSSSETSPATIGHGTPRRRLFQ